MGPASYLSVVVISKNNDIMTSIALAALDALRGLGLPVGRVELG